MLSFFTGLDVNNYVIHASTILFLLIFSSTNFCNNYYWYINYYIYWAITHKKTQVQAFKNRNEVFVNDFLKQNNLEFIPRNNINSSRKSSDMAGIEYFYLKKPDERD